MWKLDSGFERHSQRDAQFLQSVADGPGITEFQFDVDLEQDGDAFATSFDPFLTPQVVVADLRLSRTSDFELEDSLEALESLGVEFADPDSLEAIEAYEDEEEISGLPAHLVAMFDEDDEESAIAALDPKYLVERLAGAISTFRSVEVVAQTTAGRRQGSPRFNTEAILRGTVEAARLVSKAIVAEEQRKAAEAKKPAAKPAPSKGNGHKPATPPVGKFLKGTVVGSGPLGLLVEIEGGIEVRIAVADEYGHGSQTAALKWLHGHAVGQKVRVRVKYVNGAIYGVLTYEKHQRPWQQRQRPQTKEVSQPQTEAPAAN